MPTPPLEDDRLLETLRVHRENGEVTRNTAADMGLSIRTIQERLAVARQRGITLDTPPAIEFPVFDDDDVPVEQIIDHMHARTDRAIERQRQEKWFSIKVNSDEPIAIAWVGDPLGS